MEGSSMLFQLRDTDKMWYYDDVAVLGFGSNGFSETLTSTYESTQRQNSEYHHLHPCENLTSH
jgi:hypothetical protein